MRIEHFVLQNANISFCGLYIILTTGQAWAQTATTQKVFTSIKELRDGAQTISDKTLNDVVIQFNEATVVAVMKNGDEKDRKSVV